MTRRCQIHNPTCDRDADTVREYHRKGEPGFDLGYFCGEHADVLAAEPLPRGMTVMTYPYRALNREAK